MIRALRALSLSISVPLLAAAGACGGGDSGGDGGGATTDSSAFAAEYCALLAPCCAAAGLGGLTGSEQRGCKQLMGAVPPSDPTAVQPCLDAYREQSKSPDFCGLQLPQPDACKRAFPQQGVNRGGTKAPGQPCQASDDCAPSTAGLVVCGASKCQLMTHAASGAACSANVAGGGVVYQGDGDSIAACYRDDGLACEGGACKPISAVGGPCGSDSTCADGAFCASGKCAARRPPGSPCGGAPSACDATSYCDDFGSEVCEPLVAEGGACETNKQCATGYCYPNKCGKRQAAFALLALCQ